MNYKNTLTKLNQRILFHQHELSLVRAAKAALESEVGFIYEVYIQANAPRHYLVIAQGGHLTNTIEEAGRLWKERNKDCQPYPELFIRVGEIRIAIDPVDAGPGFTLDSCISDYPKKMVFDTDEDPGCYYAHKTTPQLIASSSR